MYMNDECMMMHVCSVNICIYVPVPDTLVKDREGLDSVSYSDPCEALHIRAPLGIFSHSKIGFTVYVCMYVYMYYVCA
jgi:hypothetical protein